MRLYEIIRDPHKAEAEIERLRAALKPFAKHAEVYDCWGPDRDGSPLQTEHVEGGEEFDFTIGDLRNARSALIEQTVAEKKS